MAMPMSNSLGEKAGILEIAEDGFVGAAGECDSRVALVADESANGDSALLELRNNEGGELSGNAYG
jgi:hypothetical protein